jgi:hypothetical protein
LGIQSEVSKPPEFSEGFAFYISGECFLPDDFYFVPLHCKLHNLSIVECPDIEHKLKLGPSFLGITFSLSVNESMFIPAV